jgi:hypothetical protein
MKILLVQPPSSDPLSDRIFLFEPLGLEYLAAGLKLDGHQVEILDARLTPDIDSACRRWRGASRQPGRHCELLSAAITPPCSPQISMIRPSMSW